MERRKEKRVEIHHPVYYRSLDADAHRKSENAGVALNVSSDGMLIESSEAIQARDLAIMIKTRAGEILTVAAMVLYSIKADEHLHRTGVLFQDKGEAKQKFVKEITATVSRPKSRP
jgi:hypothetical protein